MKKLTAGDLRPERPPVCRTQCGHHHADGDPFDPALISGPPCEGCRWCQAIAKRHAPTETPPCAGCSSPLCPDCRGRR